MLHHFSKGTSASVDFGMHRVQESIVHRYNGTILISSRSPRQKNWDEGTLAKPPQDSQGSKLLTQITRTIAISYPFNLNSQSYRGRESGFYYLNMENYALSIQIILHTQKKIQNYYITISRKQFTLNVILYTTEILHIQDKMDRIHREKISAYINRQIYKQVRQAFISFLTYPVEKNTTAELL